MELRHVAERRLPLLLLRSPPGLRHGSSSTSFLASQRPASQTSRSFTSSPSIKADGKISQAPSTTSAADIPSKTPSSNTASSEQDIDSVISQRLDFARGNQPATAKSPPLNRNPNVKQEEPRTQATTVKELLQQIKETSSPNTPSSGRTFIPGRGGNALGLGNLNRRGLDGIAGRAQTGTDDSTQTIAGMLKRMPGGDLQRAIVSATAAPPLRINASLGRTVRVDTARNMDLGRAFRQLDVTLSRNRVRADFNRQRFHERPGLKRKRQRSERWRRRFKEGFQDVVRRVEELRRQGW